MPWSALSPRPHPSWTRTTHPPCAYTSTHRKCRDVVHPRTGFIRWLWLMGVVVQEPARLAHPASFSAGPRHP
ncbi:hypothetical protein SKAU_G00295760 [Synaphobranchus kaupii]|uniref:Uncharacterized protein n=1 Tax=Synaphobranchus kaupii TaxID=118154 RepID=A0A9Q1EUR6_SYNKA|nr:hypothetical protein SKAU_G00295760 [Synaphobranchus kaupii]